MLFMFLCYNDEAKLRKLTPEELTTIVDDHVRYDFDVMGVDDPERVLAVRRLQPTPTAVTLRPDDTGIRAEQGAYGSGDLALSAFYLVDCESLEEATALAREYPMIDLGCVEVRPVMGSWIYAPSIETSAPPEAVWRHYTDVASWPEWMHDIRQASLDGPFVTGATGTIEPVGTAAMPLRIARVVDGSAYSSETELPDGSVLRLDHRLAELPGGGTRITHTVSLPRSALDVFGMDFSPRFNAGMVTTLEALAKLATDAGDPNPGATENTR
jgi:uncharacterized protein YndB with AHSA1/START domain